MDRYGMTGTCVEGWGVEKENGSDVIISIGCGGSQSGGHSEVPFCAFLFKY